MIWFTSDLHLGHANIIGHCDRPFSSADEMDEALLDAINDRVGMSDTLWVLGDFSFHSSIEGVCAYRRRILCNDVRLVRGNHDKHWEGSPVDCPFQMDSPYEELKTSENRKLVLFHYPIAEWNGLFHGALHLHGHQHNSPTYNKANLERGLLRYDVGVDANGYVPVTLDELLVWARGAEKNKDS